jgi:hypothetical protein
MEFCQFHSMSKHNYLEQCQVMLDIGSRNVGQSHTGYSKKCLLHTLSAGNHDKCKATTSLPTILSAVIMVYPYSILCLLSLIWRGETNGTFTLHSCLWSNMYVCYMCTYETIWPYIRKLIIRKKIPRSIIFIFVVTVYLDYIHH